MTINKQAFPFPLSAAFVTILEKEIDRSRIQEERGVIINFRDPNYSSETGGFHPVEVRIANGLIEYITDFAYVGIGPYAELAKEIDFDFSLGLFQHFGHEYPIAQGLNLYRIWEKNFVSYFQMGVFRVEVEFD